MSEHNHIAAAISFAALTLALAELCGCAYDDGYERSRETVVYRGDPAPVDDVIYVEEPPPPIENEIIIERDRPSPSHVWVGGYWHHEGGRYNWVRGRWAVPPRGRTTWVSPRWERRGRGYEWHRGYWR